MAAGKKLFLPLWPKGDHDGRVCLQGQHFTCSSPRRRPCTGRSSFPAAGHGKRFLERSFGVAEDVRKHWFSTRKNSCTLLWRTSLCGRFPLTEALGKISSLPNAAGVAWSPWSRCWPRSGRPRPKVRWWKEIPGSLSSYWGSSRSSPYNSGSTVYPHKSMATVLRGSQQDSFPKGLSSLVVPANWSKKLVGDISIATGPTVFKGAFKTRLCAPLSKLGRGLLS